MCALTAAPGLDRPGAPTPAEMECFAQQRAYRRPVHPPMRRLLFFLIACAVAAHLHAESEFAAHRGWLHLNGYSHHFAVDDANDRLLGIGYTHYRRLYGRVLPAWEFDAFQDSAKKFSGYVGHSWTLPLRALSCGVTGAIMYHRNFAAQNQLKTLPVAFPFVESRGTGLKVRAYYIPPLRRASDAQLAVQVVWALRR